MEQAHEERLNYIGIKPTAIRLLVYKTILNFRDTFSLTDLEDELQSVDKSTLFRTLSLFCEHHLLHTVDDGSGSLKYCLCHNHGLCTIGESHCHFYCESCQKTYCLDELPIPSILLPDGFVAQNINYVIKGLCPECAHKK